MAGRALGRGAKGGDANQVTNGGCAPVYGASEEGHTSALKLLLKSGADVHKPSGQGMLPVWVAAAEGHE